MCAFPDITNCFCKEDWSFCCSISTQHCEHYSGRQNSDEQFSPLELLYIALFLCHILYPAVSLQHVLCWWTISLFQWLNHINEVWVFNQMERSLSRKQSRYFFINYRTSFFYCAVSNRKPIYGDTRWSAFFFLLGNILWMCDVYDVTETLSWTGNSETTEQENGDLKGG